MLKKFLALVLAGAMVLGAALPALAATDGSVQNPVVPNTYTVTVKNVNPDETGASIVDKTFNAFKLFEVNYVETLDGTTNTVYAQDKNPHSYYIKWGSPFLSNEYLAETISTSTGVTTYALKQKKDENTEYTQEEKDARDASPAAMLLKYFVLTKLPNQSGTAADDQLIQVTPIEDASGNSTFDADKAYDLAEELKPTMDAILADPALKTKWTRQGVGQRSSSANSGETAVIDVSELGGGYYLVSGEGKAYKEGDTTEASGDDVTAAIALTTTDPKAEIIAKLDATKTKKTINEPQNPKYNNKAIGDTVPFVVEGQIPNMSGYETYFFIMHDTMVKGLKLNDSNDITVDDPSTTDVDERNDGIDNGFKVVITKADGTEVVLTRVANYAAAITAAGNKDVQENGTTVSKPVNYKNFPEYVPVKNATNNTLTYYVVTHAEDASVPEGTFEVVLHDAIQYKGQLVTEANVDTLLGDGTKDSGDKAKIGTYYSEFDGAKIEFFYSATVTEDAKLGNQGNVNEAAIEFSNKPDLDNDGTPGDNDRPGVGEGYDDVTKLTPKSKTVTYVTGFELLKYTIDKSDSTKKNPLAGAEFTFVGTDLKHLVKEVKEIYRLKKSDEDASAVTIYKLTGDRFTEQGPTYDKILVTEDHGVTYNAITAIPAEWTKNNKIYLPDKSVIQYGNVREYEDFATATLTSKVVYTIDNNLNETANTLYLDFENTNTIQPKYVKDEVTSASEKKFRKSSTGTWYLLNDGTYTQDAPTSATQANYASTTDKYEDITDAWDTMTDAEKEELTVRIKAETDENGKLMFHGLAAGDYVLTEIKAPTGYNLLDQPLDIKVEWTVPTMGQSNTNVADTDACTWVIKTKPHLAASSAYVTLATSDGEGIYDLLQVQVENKTGVELPSTGGIGTTIFYMGGAVLVLLAGVLLVSKRRMA